MSVPNSHETTLPFYWGYKHHYDEAYRKHESHITGVSLSRRFDFENFLEVFAFVTKVALLSEKRKHHPDITFGYNYAVVELTTHAAGQKLTPADYKLANDINLMLGEQA